MTSIALIGTIVFFLSFSLIVWNRFNNAAVALIGAIIFIFLHVLEGESVYESIDWNVIFLLIGMMIIVNVLKETGIFQLVAIKIVKLSRGNPKWLLVTLSTVTAILSAFFDNVTTVLLIIPITLLICNELAIPPLPFALVEIFAANAGGAATLIGDPPNLIIGSAAHISFNQFLIYLGPVILVILLAFNLLALLIWGKKITVTEARRKRIMNFDESGLLASKRVLLPPVIVVTLVFLGFMMHHIIDVDAGFIALVGAAILLFNLRGERVQEIFAEVEWETIFFFIGLFIMVQGLASLGILEFATRLFLELTDQDLSLTTSLLLWFSGLFSGIVNNVPLVATLVPIIENLEVDMGISDNVLWWATALGSCLGGNLTIVGASANVVGISILEKNGVTISFVQFLKYGSIFTFLSLIISFFYLLI